MAPFINLRLEVPGLCQTKVRLTVNKDRLKCILLGLTRFELKGLEKRFVQSVETYLNQNQLLTDQQESILEGLYREKIRFIKTAILLKMVDLKSQ